MKDFVLEQAYTGCLNTQIQIWRNYANFLNQPLTLGMFVPCDLEGNVLPAPYETPKWNTIDWRKEDAEEWKQAKKRILFEIEGMEYHVNEIAEEINGSTIEDLCINNPNRITLTPTAQKQLGL